MPLFPAPLGSFLFNLFLPLWTVWVGTLGLPLMAAPPLVALKVASVWARGVIAGLSFFCSIRHEIRGSEYLPKEPCIIAAKHQSAWDTVILLALLDAPSYILKRELLFLPFYGWYLRKIGMIAVNRKDGAKALKRMREQVSQRLAEGRTIVIFPEGTRTTPGSHHPYHSGVAALYASSDVPVVPVALNSGLYWGKGRFLKKPGTIILEYLPPIPPGLPRKIFMERLEGQIERASEALLKEAAGRGV